MERENEIAIFSLAAIGSECGTEDTYRREGHTARTLVREDAVRVVLVVMKPGARIAEQRANETSSVHALSGHVLLRLPKKMADLPAGQLLMLERGLQHDVEAALDSAFLLTLADHGICTSKTSLSGKCGCDWLESDPLCAYVPPAFARRGEGATGKS